MRNVHGGQEAQGGQEFLFLQTETSEADFRKVIKCLNCDRSSVPTLNKNGTTANTNTEKLPCTAWAMLFTTLQVFLKHLWLIMTFQKLILHNVLWKASCHFVHATSTSTSSKMSIPESSLLAVSKSARAYISKQFLDYRDLAWREHAIL